MHEWRVWLFVVTGLSHIKNARHLHLSIEGSFLNHFGCRGLTFHLMMKEIVELSEKALAPSAVTWKRNERFGFSRVFDFSRRGKLATHPRCSTREGSSCSRLWFGDHSKGVWEIVRKKERTTYLLDDKHGGGKGLLTASRMLSRGEQNWIESSQRAYRWSTDGGEHTEREGEGYRYVSTQYERVISIGC